VAILLRITGITKRAQAPRFTASEPTWLILGSQ
jgi:hypothetical protein